MDRHALYGYLIRLSISNRLAIISKLFQSVKLISIVIIRRVRILRSFLHFLLYFAGNTMTHHRLIPDIYRHTQSMFFNSAMCLIMASSKKVNFLSRNINKYSYSFIRLPISLQCAVLSFRQSCEYGSDS